MYSLPTHAMRANAGICGSVRCHSKWLVANRGGAPRFGKLVLELQPERRARVSQPGHPLWQKTTDHAQGCMTALCSEHERAHRVSGSLRRVAATAMIHVRLGAMPTVVALMPFGGTLKAANAAQRQPGGHWLMTSIETATLRWRAALRLIPRDADSLVRRFCCEGASTCGS